ncbi:surface antigen BspA-like [Trichomonas vaginalis G3]|uniref:Surface antigen BspA-like n=1 Tax=Trichomonas vaginalis (strain ATCC PRA-98 / G3) TaxID=412133 RepID=A2DNE2_TRIV3|nr:structural constituent of cell wall [Trichomonas vaginalis G3]EAY18130.1 surface antigen BspA-like [Trichomonas vaginalis G3]KAI5492407.1 structural constituent of cell wall [Trichomonas vaginalis G3]|eukprot:XP_001579116.1 surface antigen BspA-like [Trichomonas vaginalis G3]
MAFYNCINLEELKIPATLTDVSTSVFYNCMKLKLDVKDNIHIGYADNMLLTNQRKSLSDYFGNDPNKDLVIPDGVETVGYSIFKEKQLRSVLFNGRTLTSISPSAFYKCTLESVTLSANLNFIGKRCFQECPNLKRVEFSNNQVLTAIPKYCFYNCPQLTNIVLPSSITTINEYAFGSCPNINEIGLSATQIQTIGTFAFADSSIANCDNGKNLLSLDYGAFINSKVQSVTISTRSISEKCFYNCFYLTSVTLDNNIDSIEASAFEGCLLLREFVIPSSLTVIKSFAFRSCESLYKVSLSLNSVLSEIYGGAFIRCPLLVSIKLDQSDSSYRFSNGALTNHEETKLITFLPSSPIDTYVVPMTTTSIGNYAFMSCTHLVRILFSGNNIQSIGRESFKDCSKLAFLFITSTSLSTIGDCAFDNSPLLRKCGAVRCDSSKTDLFIQRNIPEISFRMNCSNTQITCLQQPVSSTHVSILLISPFILM